MLIAVTILATLKVAPNAPIPSEEVIVPSQEVVAETGGTALLIVAAKFADIINKVADTHTFRHITRSLNSSNV